MVLIQPGSFQMGDWAGSGDKSSVRSMRFGFLEPLPWDNMK